MRRGLFSMQLHWTAAAFLPHASSPSLPSEPELRSLWNVMSDLKREKCVGRHDELRIESSQLLRAFFFFCLFVCASRAIARNLDIINCTSLKRRSSTCDWDRLFRRGRLAEPVPTFIYISPNGGISRTQSVNYRSSINDITYFAILFV